jgi:hypothetical protein
MTRNGKIARLPWHIRDTLNARLLDGEPGGPLLEWLNAQPQVVEILKTYFKGVAINAQSLSEWRQGGFKDWVRHKEACEEVERLTEQAVELDDSANNDSVIEMAAKMMAVEFARSMKEMLADVSDPKERWAKLQELLPLLAQFRRAEHRAVKIEMDQEKWQRERDRLEKEDIENKYAEAKRRAMAPLMDKMRRGTLTEAFGGGKTGEQIADLIIELQNIHPPDPDGPWRERPEVLPNGVLAHGHQEENEKTGKRGVSTRAPGRREYEKTGRFHASTGEDVIGEEVHSPSAFAEAMADKKSKVQSRGKETIVGRSQTAATKDGAASLPGKEESDPIRLNQTGSDQKK